MSADKPKRPSARPSARASTVPPPPAVSKDVVVPPAPVPSEAQAPAGPSHGRKVRISARRAPGARDSAPPPPAPVPPRQQPAARPAASPKKPVVAKRVTQKSPPKVNAPTAPQTNGEVREPVEPAVEVAASPVAATEPAETPSERPEPADDDDDIWHEADAGTSSLMTALVDEGDDAERAAPPAASTRLARSRRDDKRDEAVRLASAETLVSTDYYFRQYGAHGMRSLSAEVDEFGLDPHVEERARPWLEGLCKRYFRVDVDGVQNLPEGGPVLMVGNRAGALPWDGLVLRTAVRMARPGMQPVRWLAEDSVFHYPFLGVFMNRLGAVRACPENAERLLRQERLVAVFPEGAHGSSKLFKDRYRLQRFGRGGYVKLALKLGAPIVPTAIIGSEETNPVLARSRVLGRILGGESLPITPTFPWLGAAGLLPAPVKWRIVIGEPIDLSAYGPRSADDALVVHRLNEQIRGILQSLVDQALDSRRSVVFG